MEGDINCLLVNLQHKFLLEKSDHASNDYILVSVFRCQQTTNRLTNGRIDERTFAFLELLSKLNIIFFRFVLKGVNYNPLDVMNVLMSR